MSEPAPAAAPSRSAALKVVATVLVIGGAVAVLLTASISKGAEYYKHVDEVMTNADGWRGKRLQVHGNVVDGSIEQKPGTLEYRFKIETRDPRPHAVITANYTGLVPDTFKSGAEVVATGKLGEGDALQVIPDGIMAKCPSKYDAAKIGGAAKTGVDPSVKQL
jgi:cytochrome c-type biogenesis protein CcmE